MQEKLRKKDRTSSIRWQQATIAQMGYTINTLMSLAVPSLGFILHKVSDVNLPCQARIALTIAGLSMSLSILSSLAGSMNRLYSFRATQSAARNRENREYHKSLCRNQDPNDISDHIKAEIDGDRAAYKRRDRRTWYLLWAQAVTFATGTLIAGIGILFLSA